MALLASSTNTTQNVTNRVPADADDIINSPEMVDGCSLIVWISLKDQHAAAVASILSSCVAVCAHEEVQMKDVV